MEMDEVLRKIKGISDNLCKVYIEPYCETLDEMCMTTAVKDNSDERGHLKILADNVSSELHIKITEADAVLKRHLETITQKRTQVEDLTKVCEKLKTEHKNMERNLEKTKKLCQDYENKIVKLQHMRDCIQTYKILTGTNFVFNKEGTAGYIKNGNAFEVFNFNNAQVNQQDIQKKLWSLLKKISNEDYKNLKEHTENNKKTILS